jgi:LacI family transcriptional regulator
LAKRDFGTITDVARKAGVSISTVSRVLNNNYPVRASVRSRVLEIADQLKYRPNSIAKNLRTSTSRMIGFILADMGNYLFMQIAKGIEQAVSASGYNIMIAGSDGDVQKERRLLRAMLEERPAALIISSFDSTSHCLKDFIDLGIPVVMTDRYLDDFGGDVVVLDNYQAAYSMTNYLIERGHRDIAIANVLLSISSGRERYAGFLAALSERKIKLNNRYVSGGNFDALSCKTWVKELFSHKKRPTALICANSIMTEGALLALQELSLRVPEDISLVSIGKIPFQELIEPKITSSVHDGFLMGAHAGRMALDRIEGKKTEGGEKIILESRLVEYGSVRNV